MNRFLTHTLPEGYKDTQRAIGDAYHRARQAEREVQQSAHECDCDFCEVDDYLLSQEEIDELDTQRDDAVKEAKELEQAAKRMERYALAYGVELKR